MSQQSEHDPSSSPPHDDEETEVHIRQRQALLDKCIRNANLLQRKIEAEFGDQNVTKEHWDKYKQMASQVTQLYEQIDTMSAEVRTMIAKQKRFKVDKAPQDAAQNVTKLLKDARQIPPSLVDGAYAIILRESKSLDPVRHLHPGIANVLFNYELEPLRSEIKTLRNALSKNSEQSKLTAQLNAEVSQLRSDLEKEKLLTRQLRTQLNEKDKVQSTQQVMAENFHSLQNSALTKQLEDLQKKLGKSELEIIRLEAVVVQRDDKIGGYQKANNRLKDQRDDAVMAQAKHFKLYQTVKDEVLEANRVRDVAVVSERRTMELVDHLLSQVHTLDCRHYNFVDESSESERKYLKQISELREIENQLQEFKSLQVAKLKQKDEDLATLSKEKQALIDEERRLQGQVAEKDKLSNELRMSTAIIQDMIPHILSKVEHFCTRDISDWHYIIQCVSKWKLRPLELVLENPGCWSMETPVSSSYNTKVAHCTDMDLVLLLITHVRNACSGAAVSLKNELEGLSLASTLAVRMTRCDCPWVVRLAINAVELFSETFRNGGASTIFFWWVHCMQEVLYCAQEKFPDVIEDLKEATTPETVQTGLEDVPFPDAHKRLEDIRGQIVQAEENDTLLCQQIKDALTDHVFMATKNQTEEKHAFVAIDYDEWILGIDDAAHVLSLINKDMFTLDETVSSITTPAFRLRSGTRYSGLATNLVTPAAREWLNRHILPYIPYSDTTTELVRRLEKGLSLEGLFDQPKD